MGWEAWAVFAGFWVVFVTSPGPNAVNCIRNGMTYGFTQALWGVAAILTQAALFLALLAAFLHAVFGALQKGRHDPLLARGAIDASYGLMAAPFALFVVPWPEPHMWPIFAIAWVIHAGYKLAQAWTYSYGAWELNPFADGIEKVDCAVPTDPVSFGQVKSLFN